MNNIIFKQIIFLLSNKKNFNYFLAGLIDGDGHFSKIPQLVICFSEKDRSIAYFLQKIIINGNVRKVKNKKCYIFVISSSIGLKKVCYAIHNKLKHKQKIIQYNTRLIKINNFKSTKQKNLIIKNNFWFTGFFLSDGSFQIKIIYRKNKLKPEIRLVIQIDQKENYLLLQIQKKFGYSIGFRSKQNTYYYSFLSFISAKKIVFFFDKFPLIGVKYKQYLLWRKVYIKITEKFHLTKLGVQWIKNVKKRMQNLGKM